MIGLIRATRGRGLFISSEVKNALGLRAPADITNLMNVWGLPNDKAMDGIGSVPRSIVMNEGVKRNGFRGVVEIVKLADKPKGTAAEQEKEATEEEVGKKQRGDNNGKRKVAKGWPSKQHAKKMRVATKDNNQK